MVPYENFLPSDKLCSFSVNVRNLKGARVKLVVSDSIHPKLQNRPLPPSGAVWCENLALVLSENQKFFDFV